MTKKSLGIVGIGAFGRFMVQHLLPFFDVVACDPYADLTAFPAGVTVGTLHQVAASSIIILAVPVQKMKEVLNDMAPLVQPGTLILDVASVKIKPTDMMLSILPDNIDIVGTHPLFGPQSGKNGIEGLNIAVCNVRGTRSASVSAFLRDDLKLKVFEVTAEQHDRELAYVHGLTHMLAKVIVALDLPTFQLTTKTYELMSQAVEFVRYDSDELFKAIERENPFSAEAKSAFFTAARNLEERLTKD